MAAIGMALRSRRGRWILAGHREATCELALTGVCDGITVAAVIDRTFVDKRGVRWVIDYKTTECRGGESREEFLDRETARYRGQLEDYRRLLALHMPQQPVRSALYFPLLDAWRELG
jgi:ATP-dependent exoDNAse (exonuclease V) beta subunit